MLCEPMRRVSIQIIRVIQRPVQYIRVKFEQCLSDVEDSRIFAGESIECDGRFAIIIEDVVNRSLGEHDHLVCVDGDRELFVYCGVGPDGSGCYGTSHGDADEFCVG